MRNRRLRRTSSSRAPRRLALAAATAAAAFGGLADAAPGATSRTFKAAADTYVDARAPRATFGSRSSIRVAAGGNRAYLRFHVRGVEGPVKRATLAIRSIGVAGTHFSVRRTASTRWSEQRTSFVNAPRIGHRWPRVRAQGRTGWTVVDVTRLVRGNEVVSLALVPRSAKTRVRFASRESGTSARLTVTAMTPKTSPRGSEPQPSPTPPPPVTAFASPGISVGGSFQGHDDATRKRVLDGMEQIGARSIRFDCPWVSVERTRGSYDWARIDRAVAAARARGLDVLLSLSYSPGWANGGRDNKYPPHDQFFGDYAAFAREAARRYSLMGVKAFEIWNEPNLGGQFWKPTAEPERYARLLALAYDAIKSAAPNAVVVGMALSPAADFQPGNLSPNTYAKRAYAAGAKLDALSIHPYLDSRNDPVFSWETWQFGDGSSATGSWFGPRSVRQTMIENGDGAKRIWGTEMGQPIGGQLAGEAVSKTLSRWRSYPFTGAAFWYNYVGDGEYSLVNDDFSPRPAWHAFRNFVK